MNIYGYARVSSSDQNLARQLEAFDKFGVPVKNVFSDKRSGKDFERTEYRRLTDVLRRGDLLVILSLDRLGRDYEQILYEWKRITKTIGADICVIDMPVLDTRSRGGTLAGRFIADVVLQVLSFVAENERTKIRTRRADGIRLAKARGVKFGRPRTVYSDDFILTMRGYAEGRVSRSAAMKNLGIGKSAFFKHLSRLKESGAL